MYFSSSENTFQSGFFIVGRKSSSRTQDPENSPSNRFDFLEMNEFAQSLNQVEGINDNLQQKAFEELLE